MHEDIDIMGLRNLAMAVLSANLTLSTRRLLPVCGEAATSSVHTSIVETSRREPISQAANLHRLLSDIKKPTGGVFP